MSPELFEATLPREAREASSNERLGTLFAKGAGRFYFYHRSEAHARELGDMIIESFCDDNPESSETALAIAASMWQESFKVSTHGKLKLFSPKFEPSLHGYPCPKNDPTLVFEDMLEQGRDFLENSNNLEAFSAWYRHIEEVITCSNSLEMQ